MTLEGHKENSSEQYIFQLTPHELSYLRSVVRQNIEETEIHRGGKFHDMSKQIYAKLCQGYVTQPEINQLPDYLRLPNRY